MRKLKSKILIAFLSLFLLPAVSFAVCPVCSIAVAGGIGISRWLGIDDTISGIWIGGLIVSLSLWFISWLDKKNVKFKLRSFLSFALFYLITLLPLYKMGIVGSSCNRLWGCDKVIVGVIFGGIAFGASVILDKILRKRNNGRVYFYYQKVIIPVSFLIVLSIIFYFITRC